MMKRVQRLEWGGMARGDITPALKTILLNTDYITMLQEVGREQTLLDVPCLEVHLVGGAFWQIVGTLDDFIGLP